MWSRPRGRSGCANAQEGRDRYNKRASIIAPSRYDRNTATYGRLVEIYQHHLSVRDHSGIGCACMLAGASMVCEQTARRGLIVAGETRVLTVPVAEAKGLSARHPTTE